MKHGGESLIEVIIALVLMMLLTLVLAPILKSPAFAFVDDLGPWPLVGLVILLFVILRKR